MPKISVIVPAYRPLGFDALRTSIEANADADAEWIVVDDGSGPDWDSVFAELDGTPARLIRQDQNRRQGAARNAGLAQATGPWIKFLDADDRLDEGHLSALLLAAEADKTGSIPFAPTCHVFPGGRMSVNESWRNVPHTPEAQLARLISAPFLHHCGALFPRGLLKELGGYDETLITDEDGDLLIRIFMQGYLFKPVPEVKYFYLHHEGARVSADDDPRKLDARERVCDKVIKAFEGRGAVPDTIREALAQRLDTIAMSAWENDKERGELLLAKARAVFPSYRFPGRLPLRIARRIGGPNLVRRASALARRFRGRLAGGMRA